MADYEIPAANPSFKIILGSSSIPRRNILAEMGYEFTVMTADIDEKGIRKEKPEDLVMALAKAKVYSCKSNPPPVPLPSPVEDPPPSPQPKQSAADAIISRLGTSVQKENDAVPTLLITADQVVVHEGIIREKPSSKEEARQFITGYSKGQTSTVGSVLVTNLKTGTKRGACDRAEVYFHDIPNEVIESLIEEAVVLNVAGGLLVEHPLISPFVEAVVGTTDSVMGLPKALTQALIQEALYA